MRWGFLALGPSSPASAAASQSLRLLVGPTMSPMMRIVPAILPSRLEVPFADDSGTMSARGSPKRVTRIGWRVLRTCSTIAEHLTLNTEKSISFIQPYFLVPGGELSSVPMDMPMEQSHGPERAEPIASPSHGGSEKPPYAAVQ
jgi:hypothetical protein